jgi:F-type H+-transporting ATPase subunit a
VIRATFLAFATLLAVLLCAQHEPASEVAHATEAHGEHAGEVEGFNAGKLIMSHIADEHGWHIAGDISLPLPVILYDTRSGLHVFSSARFEHGHATYNGYMLHDGAIKAVDAAGTIDEAGSKAIWDISITKNVVSLFLVMIALVLVFTSVARAYTKRAGQAPKGLQSFMEPIILFVRDDVAKANIGPGMPASCPTCSRSSSSSSSTT